MPFDGALTRDHEHDIRTLATVRKALASVPFYAKQNLTDVGEGTLTDVLARLPLLTREQVRKTLPKVWFPEGRDAKAELASGSVAVVEAGSADSRVRVLFDPKWWRMQEQRALAIHPRAASALAGELGTFRDAVLWVPERGTGSCGSGDPGYEERLEGSRLHLNSRQDPTFWTEPVMTRMLEELSLHETTALLGDPFYLDVLARHAAVLGRRLDVRGFVATTRSRPTLAHRAAIARVYQGAVVDVLGAREVGTLFVQGDDGKMHHAPFSTHVELLRAKVETPGASDVALVVVTTLEREIQPLVRYVLGDLVQIAPGESRYTTVPPIASVEGSIDDAIVRPDGAIVTPGAIDRAIGEETRAYQVTQSDPTTVEVEVVGGSPSHVEQALAPLLGAMRITARNATAIGVESNGKYRTTRRRLPLGLSAAFEACEGA
jgi:phenylacetate-coenzyme A ligase PaaK-like adenylate-forming protein